MGQRIAGGMVFVLLTMACWLAGCERSPSAPSQSYSQSQTAPQVTEAGQSPSSPTSSPLPISNASPGATRVTVASLVPAATDMIVSMGLADRLVGVSTYDLDRPDIPGVPAVGDYLTVDWEQLAKIRPNDLIVEIDPARLPEGFAQRAGDLGITIHNFDLKRLSDVYLRMAEVGKALRDPDAADRAIEQMRRRLAAVAAKAELANVATTTSMNAMPTSGSAASPGAAPAGKRIAALMVTDDGETAGVGLAGVGTFLDDLLALAGGANVAAPLNAAYPTVDDETLATLRPSAIFLLMPGAAPAAIERAKSNLEKFTDMPAVRDGRIYIFDERYALMPGAHAPELAEKMFACLHPDLKSPAPAPASATSPEDGASTAGATAAVAGSPPVSTSGIASSSNVSSSDATSRPADPTGTAP